MPYSQCGVVMDKKDTSSGVSRRRLLQAAGAGVAGGAVLYGLDKLRLLPSFEKPLPVPAAESMTYRQNPKNGDKISLLGFGCMRFPMLPGADSPTGPEVNEQGAFALIDYAMAHGVNYYDTAWPYHRGVSESVTGKALQRYPRESYFLADKMPTYLLPTLEQAKEIFEKQLEKCKVEYFDYYLLHAIRFVEDYQTVYEKNGVLDYLLEQKKQGRIRNLGWSFHGNTETLEYLLSRNVQWDFAMVQLNYHDMMHEYKIAPNQARFIPKDPAPTQWMFEKMQQSGLPLIVMEPLLGGRLARLNKKALAVLQAERPQASAASWAFRYVAGLPNVITMLSGMTYMEHLQDNIRTYSPLEPLTQEEFDLLADTAELMMEYNLIPCTTCQYCMPCPYGIDIPAVFMHYNKCLSEHNIVESSQDPNYRKARQAFLVGYDRSVPKLRQASHCINCGQCVPHCPQAIKIPQEMRRINSYVEQLKQETL